MNKQQYLIRKQELREQPAPAGRTVCVKCLRPPQSCFCAGIVPFESQSEIRILMHPKEARKEKVGTGRLANLCCTRSKIIVDVNFSHNSEVQKILSDDRFFPILLYPGENAHNLSSAPLSFDGLSQKTPLFFVIDGTWPCAKTMMRESRILHALPRVSFDVFHASRFSIKQQPLSTCLSTIESIFELFNCLDKWQHENLQGQHQILLATLEKLVQFQIACALDPSKKSYRTARTSGYKDPSQRKYPKKWQERKICFENKNYPT